MAARWQEVVIGLGGLWLLVSPLLVETSTSALVNALVVGGATLALALYMMRMGEHRRPAAVQLILALWLIISPWLLNFSTLLGAAWSAYGVGLVQSFMASWVLLEPEIEASEANRRSRETPATSPEASAPSPQQAGTTDLRREDEGL